MTVSNRFFWTAALRNPPYTRYVDDEMKILAIEHKGFSGYVEGNDFEVGEFGNNSTSWHIFQCVDTISSEILADSEDSNEILL